MARAHPIHAAPGRVDRPWRAVPRELVIVLSGILVYFGVRGLTVTNPDVAVEHALHLVNFERSLGIYVEPSLQTLVTGSTALMTVMNWIYIWGHWPVIAGTLLWLCLRHPDGYRLTRNAMLLSGGVGLVIFAAYPVAPPRLVNLGLVDTVTQYSTSYRVLQPPAFVNQYAAMPSLHVGWDLLIGLAIFIYARFLVLRIVGLLLPVLMMTSVVLTANHYIIDGVVGVVLVLVSLLVVRTLDARRRGRRGRPATAGIGHARVPAARTSPEDDCRAPGRRC